MNPFEDQQLLDDLIVGYCDTFSAAEPDADAIALADEQAWLEHERAWDEHCRTFQGYPTPAKDACFHSLNSEDCAVCLADGRW